MALQYLHSHVASEINDNSSVSIVSDGGTVGFFPIFADKGEDNELVLIEGGVNEFYTRYGVNGAKFGQAHLNVVQWLMGGGSAYIMRLLPEDASYASAGLVVKVDSYIPEYHLKVKLPAALAASVGADTFIYKIGEKYIFEDSVIKELAIVNYDGRGHLDIDPSGANPEKNPPIFRTGRGSSLEEDWDIADDWMRNNGYATEDDPEKADENGIVPIKTYVNYSILKDIFPLLASSGTRAFSPYFTESLIEFLDIDNPVMLYDGKKIVLVKPVAKPAELGEGATEEQTAEYNSALEAYEAYAAEEVNNEILVFQKEFCEGATDSSVAVENTYVLRDENGEIISNFDPEWTALSGKVQRLFHPYASSIDPEKKDHPEKITSYKTDEEGYLSGEWIDVFVGDFDELKTIMTNLITSKNPIKEKAALFKDPTKVVLYYNAKAEVKEAITTDVEADKIQVTIEDKAFKAAYFIDGYPIEIFKTGSVKETSNGKVPLYNAKFTIVDPETGSSDVRVIFKTPDEGGYIENQVYIFLDQLSKFNGIYPELKRRIGWISTDEKDYSTEKLVPSYNIDNTDETIGYKLLTFSDLNINDLSCTVYGGAKDFTRKNADQVTVEVVNVPAANAYTKDGVKLYLKTLDANYNTNTTNIIEGRKQYTLGYFTSKYRGEYYNNYKIIMNLNNNYRDTYDFRLYDIEIYDTSDNKTKLIDGPFTVALYKDALDRGGASLYIKSILDTYGQSDVTYFDDIDENAFKNLSNDLSSIFRTRHPSFVFNTAAVDPLFIPQVDEIYLARANDEYEYHSYLATTDDESIPADQRVARIQGDNNISTATTAILSRGFNLGGGSSGSLVDKRGNLIASVRRNLLMQAFTGSINPDVTDKWNYEFDVILDAAYPNTVKNRMVQLASSLRGDCIVCLDTDNMASSNSGPSNSVDAAVRARKAFAVSDYVASIWSQNTIAYDEYSGRDIPVSATYLLAYKIPSNDKANGIESSFVGPRRGGVTLTSPLNWYPSTVEKEKLYKAQINYISRYPDKTIFDNQLTSQVMNTALSNIPNVRVLFKMRRACEKIADNFRFERNSGYTRFDLEEALNNYLEMWVDNGACSSVSAKVNATDYMIKQKMCEVTIDLTFVGFLERILITFNVNG